MFIFNLLYHTGMILYANSNVNISHRLKEIKYNKTHQSSAFYWPEIGGFRQPKIILLQVTR